MLCLTTPSGKVVKIVGSFIISDSGTEGETVIQNSGSSISVAGNVHDIANAIQGNIAAESTKPSTEQTPAS